MSNQSFLSVPPDIADPVVLRRFLSRVLEQLDITYSNRNSTDSLLNQDNFSAELKFLTTKVEELNQALSSILAQQDAPSEDISKQDEVVTSLINLTAYKQPAEDVTSLINLTAYKQPAEDVLHLLSLVKPRYEEIEIPVEVPVGCIMLWSGSVASIPATYALCDGTNGTPDLRNRFVLAAGDLYTPGEVGGKNEYASGDVKTELANTVINSSITLTTQSINNPATGTPVTIVTDATISVSADQHLHNLSGFSNMPAFYALAYIMRISV